MTEPKNKKKEDRLKRAGAVLLALALWQLAAMLVKEELLLVSPIKVLLRLTELIAEKGFWSSVAFSLIRIAAGFFLGLAAGFILSFLAYRFSLLEILLWPFVTLMRSVPLASFIILALMLFSSARLSVFISFLMVFPLAYGNLLEGLKTSDPALLEMASVYHLSAGRRFAYIYWPHIKAFFLASCTAGLGLAWKSGIAAEVIGIPDGSIGERLYEAKIYLATADLLAWTLVIILLSMAFEKLFVLLIRILNRKWEENA